MAHRHLPYYHPHLNSIEAVRNLMTNYVTQDGAFILRNSFTKADTLTVTVMHNHSIKHFSLCRLQNKYMLQQQFFDTVKDLIDYYMIHDVPNEEKVNHLRLLHPINARPMSLPVTNRPVPVPPGGRSMGARSQSVVAPPPLSLVSPQHRGSVDSNMPVTSNGFAGAGAGLSPSASGTNAPQLPLNKPKKKEHRFKLGFFKGKRSSSSASDTGSTLARTPEDRGPAPLPAIAATEKDSHYYSVVGSENVDRSKDLMEHIAQFESPEDDRCECGLTFEESELPCGWTMHLSQDANTFGLLFFMGPNKETEWNLPFDVSLQLTPDQQDSIRRLREPSKRSSSSSSGSFGASRQSGAVQSGAGQSGAGQSGAGQSGAGQSGAGQMSYGRQATEHECSSDEVFPSFNMP